MPVLRRYERICFEKEMIRVQGLPEAAFVCPGHPLLDALIDLTLERYRGLLKQGAILVNESDFSEDPRLLVYLEHSIRDARPGSDGQRHLVSQRLQFVELPLSGETTQAYNAGPAPYHDYQPLEVEQAAALRSALAPLLEAHDPAAWAQDYAIQHIVPEHLAEVRSQRRAPDRQDPGGGAGTADQGDRLLGSPGAGTEGARTEWACSMPASTPPAPASALTTCTNACNGAPKN